MSARQYSSIASQMTLTATINSSSTSAQVDTVAGLPALYPFTVGIDAGSTSEEVVTVTGVSGTTLTITRAQDNSTAIDHSAGAIVRHMATARDYQESQNHIYATNGVHGVVGNVVGTTDVQTLTNKTLDASLNPITNLPKTALPSDVAYTAAVQTLSNKTITAPVLTSPSVTGGVAVAGNLVLTGDETVSGNLTTAGTAQSAALHATANAQVDGTLGVTGAATVGGAATVASLTTAGAVTAASAALSGNETVGGTSVVTGASTAASYKATAMAPVYVHQVLGQDAGYGSTGAWVNHATGTIPNLSVTVPPSGRVRVTATATVVNTNSATSTAWFSYAIQTATVNLPVNGASTVQSLYQDVAGTVFTSSGAGRTLTAQDHWGVRGTNGGSRASTAWVFAGLTPGDTLLLSPQYNISSGSGGTASTVGATLLAEPLI